MRNCTYKVVALHHSDIDFNKIPNYFTYNNRPNSTIWSTIMTPIRTLYVTYLELLTKYEE